MENFLADKTVLWICFVWPEPDSSAAGTRTLQLLQQLIEAGCKVVVSSSCQRNSYQLALEQMGIQTHNFPCNDSSFDSFIQELKPDLVFFDRFMIEEQFSWRVKKYSPQSLRILDTIDLHFLRRARQASLSADKLCCDLLPEGIYQQTDCLREIAAIYRSDLSLLVSDSEFEILTKNFEISDKLLTVLPWGYEITKSCNLSFEERKNLVWIGNFNHQPNLDSFEYLRDVLWEKIRQKFTEEGKPLPELHVYGAYMPEKLQQSAKKIAGIKLHSKADCVFDTLKNYRLNLAPLRFGAGLKGKILDSWAVGTPVVTTSVGAEGLRFNNTFAGSVADTDQAYIQAVYDLYHDNSNWQVTSQFAEKILAENFKTDILKQKFLNIINELLKERPVNLIGSLLWQQQFRSTEYMSRWIELKNTITENL